VRTNRVRAGFRDRVDAGDELARRLLRYRDRPGLLVLGIPRGGVPVAARVARALRAPLDVLVARKLGLPWQEELAMGAITSTGEAVLNRELVDELGIPRAVIDRVVARERVELERREQSYRADRSPLDVAGRVVIVVDDGLATGSTMRAALIALRSRDPPELVVAVPVAPASTCAELEPLADRVVCLLRPARFLAVGRWYEDFAATSDEEVQTLLREAAGNARLPQEATR
jgi:predicted phosphoribosyltransferase